MFRLIQTSDTRGDCTASYDVQLDKEYTVKEFLETVLTQKADEWGAFYLMVRSRKLFWQNPSCEYRNGKKTGTTWANILIRYGDRRITKVCSDGGWTRMDYYIWLDEKPKEAAKPREEQKMKNELPTTDCLLVVKVPYFLKQERRQSLWEQLLKMKESGVVVLDASTQVVVVPKDIEVCMEASEGDSDKLYSDALNAFRRYASPNEIEKNENSEDKEGPDT